MKATRPRFPYNLWDIDEDLGQLEQAQDYEAAKDHIQRLIYRFELNGSATVRQLFFRVGADRFAIAIAPEPQPVPAFGTPEERNLRNSLSEALAGEFGFSSLAFPFEDEFPETDLKDTEKLRGFLRVRTGTDIDLYAYAGKVDEHTGRFYLSSSKLAGIIKSNLSVRASQVEYARLSFESSRSTREVAPQVKLTAPDAKQAVLWFRLLGYAGVLPGAERSSAAALRAITHGDRRAKKKFENEANRLTVDDVDIDALEERFLEAVSKFRQELLKKDA